VTHRRASQLHAEAAIVHEACVYVHERTAETSASPGAVRRARTVARRARKLAAREWALAAERFAAAYERAWRAQCSTPCRFCGIPLAEDGCYRIVGPGLVRPLCRGCADREPDRLGEDSLPDWAP
jgi:hypothetical protein